MMEGAKPSSSSPSAAGSPSAALFDELLSRHQGQLYGYIHSLVRDLNDADDLFQQTAVILWRKFTDYDPQRSFLAWACTVARLEISNFLRTRGRSKLYFSDELNLLLIEAHAGVSHDQWDASREALVQCIDKLRERDRRLLDACYLGEASVAAISQQEGRSSHSVHNSLRRIRRSLFECIQRTLAQASHPEAAP
jgi:RNA polymerase sigma-70 factor (ECF subfamily)